MKKTWILIIPSILFFSCKKDIEGCTDSAATNYNSEANTDDGSCNYPAPNYTCDGHETNNDFIPLIDGASWNYKQGSGTYTEDLNGTTTLSNGNTYFKRDWTQFGSITGSNYLRKLSDGTIMISSGGSSEDTLVPGVPVLGMTWTKGSSTYEVTGLNESVSAESCSYTGCLKITQHGSLNVTFYYKRGIGLVKSTDFSLRQLSFN